MTSGGKDEKNIKPLNRPVTKVYRRPRRKQIQTGNTFGIGEGIEDIRTSEWKNDKKVVSIVNKVAAGFDLADSDFSEYVFAGANLSKAKMEFCIFKDADLSFVNMMDGDFNHSDFTSANLQNANLSKADLSYADFTGANLTGANLSGANLTGAKIDMVIFSEDTDFGGVVAGEKVQKYIDKIELLQKAAEMGLVDLRTLGIVDLRKLDLRSINLKGVYLKDKDLKGRLTGVNLSGAEINESDILGADVNMLHYQMRSTNEYNDAMDAKAAARREREEMAEKADFDEQEIARVAERAVLEKESKMRLEEEENKNKRQNDKNNSQNEEKNCKIVKKAKPRVKAAKGKLIE